MTHFIVWWLQFVKEQWANAQNMSEAGDALLCRLACFIKDLENVLNTHKSACNSNKFESLKCWKITWKMMFVFQSLYWSHICLSSRFFHPSVFLFLSLSLSLLPLFTRGSLQQALISPHYATINTCTVCGVGGMGVT